MTEELGSIRPFEPCAWYDKNFDWFIYQSRNCSVTELSSRNPGIDLLRDNATGVIVGFKIIGFCAHPRDFRDEIIGVIPIDDIKNIEGVWIHNLHEMSREMSLLEIAFFKELRARNLE